MTELFFKLLRNNYKNLMAGLAWLGLHRAVVIGFQRTPLVGYVYRDTVSYCVPLSKEFHTARGVHEFNPPW